MQIPVNTGFGQALPQQAPQVNIPAGAFDVSSGVQNIAQAGMGIATDMFQKNTELARAKAANAMLDHEINVKTVTDDIHAKVQSGEIPYTEAKQAYSDAVSKIEIPKIEGVDPATAENLQRGVKRLNFGGQVTIDHSVLAAQRADFKGQWGQVLDKLGKLGGMPNADIEKINAQAEAFTPLAHQAGLNQADVSKQLQDFKDQNWTNHATQSAMQNRDNLDGLKDLSRQLTDADGFYANKLDTNKRNAILSGVTTHIIRLENKANTLADKVDALAEKTTDKLEADVMTGIPVSENRIAVDFSTVKGTSNEKRFQGVLDLAKSVQSIMAKPPVEQQSIIDGMRAELSSKGADYPAREKKLLDTLTAAHDSFVKTLQEEPLQAVALRTGQEFQPLTPQTIQDPRQIPAIMKDREAFVAAAKKQCGPDVKPRLLFNAEADMVKKALEPMTPTDQRALLGMFKQTMSGEAFRATMDQIGADPVMKLAGTSESYGYKTTEGRPVAQLLLEGRKLLQDKTTLMPKEKSSGGDAIAPAFNKYVGDALPRGEKSNEIAYAGVHAIYAVLAKDEGKNDGILDTGILERAIRFVTGGIVDYNGSKVIPPYGMEADKFTDKARQQIDGLKDKSSLTPDELRRLPLERTPDGYAFRNGRNYVPGKDGKPLTFKVAP